MVNLNSIINQKINLNKFVEIFFYTFPLSFIIGNLALAINSLIFAILSLVLIKKEKLTVKFNNVYWLLIAFYLYLILSTVINFNMPGFLRYSVLGWDMTSHPVFKSFLILRYLLLFYIIDILITNKKININFFFLSSLFCTSFVSLDVILQYITGFDLFGFKSLGPKNPGPFKDELISGGYLERFSFFSFFSFMHMSENYKNKKFSNIAFIFIIAFHSVAMLLSGNRMPLLLYFIGYFVIFFLVKKIRLVMTIAFIIFAASFYGIIQKDPIIKNYTYVSFISNINIFNFNKTIDVKKGEIKNEEKLKNEINEKRLIFLRTTGHQAIYQQLI